MAELANAAKLKNAEQFADEMAKAGARAVTRIAELMEERDALRAQLAQAREENERLTRERAGLNHSLRTLFGMETAEGHARKELVEFDARANRHRIGRNVTGSNTYTAAGSCEALDIAAALRAALARFEEGEHSGRRALQEAENG